MIIRRYQPGDETKIVELFQLVFGKPMSLEFWRWRFGDGNPWGSTIVVAMDGDTMAAHYAVCHQPATFNGQEFLTAQSMTTMTHPQYRKMGLFVACARACFKYAADTGVKFVWSFPNKNSEHGFYVDLGWTRLGNVGTRHTGRHGCSIGGMGYRAWRWGENDPGPAYGGLVLDPAYQAAFDSLELHLEDSDTYTYERDCKRLEAK